MLSESQERMLLVAEKGREEEVFGVFRKWGLDAVTMGRVIAENTMRVLHHGMVVAEIPKRGSDRRCAALHREAVERGWLRCRRKARTRVSGRESQLTGGVRSCWRVRTSARKHWVYEQYDSMVQTNTVQGPGGWPE